MHFFAINHHDRTGLQQYDGNWVETTPVAFYTEGYGGSNNGARHGTHYSPYNYRVYTSQTFEGLANGLYTLRAYGRRSGYQNQCYLEAKDYGSSQTATFPVSSTYQLVEMKDINVSNGRAKIGIWSDAYAYDYVFFDDVEFFKQ